MGDIVDVLEAWSTSIDYARAAIPVWVRSAIDAAVSERVRDGERSRTTVDDLLAKARDGGATLIYLNIYDDHYAVEFVLGSLDGWFEAPTMLQALTDAVGDPVLAGNGETPAL